MKCMSNNQIIQNEAAKLAPATLHTIATAHNTAAQIEALAAQITVTEDDGTQHPGTTHDAEIILAANELHTFDYWKKAGKSVKLHEKALIECYLWKYTTKPSKAQREAAEAEGKEAAPDPHYYPTKSHLFSCLQVEDSKPTPEARFKSAAEIMAYNKKLAAERKAAKIDLDKLYTLYMAEYSRLYNSDDPDDEKAERNAAKVFDDKSQNAPVFHALVDRMIQKMRQIPGINIYGSHRAADRGGMIGFQAEGIPFAALGRYINDHNVGIMAHSFYSPGVLRLFGIEGVVRYCIHCWNTEEEVDYAVSLLEPERLSELR